MLPLPFDDDETARRQRRGIRDCRYGYTLARMARHDSFQHFRRARRLPLPRHA